ncbi:aminodeoxychorismate/anthranilate synthase component II [Alteromonadaceae bacterium M269]|nr:aminodeoxychorismate/anthranilate synthase component II [Alteromonadaceae bacterium M269]
MLLLIDNYDSFTHNLADYFAQQGQDVVVKRNDELSIELISEMSPDYLVISPGPCTPNEAGISLSAIDYFKESLPILGVCLGHQALGQVFGGEVIQANRIQHGKTCDVYHDGSTLFAGVPNPTLVTRYHSLALAPDSISGHFHITAWSHDEDGNRQDVMAIQHKHLPLYGVQYHPESVLTEHGHEVIRNFLQS